MKIDAPKSSSLVFTIGHSTHPLEDFVGLLKAHQVQHVLDVRIIPRSRHNPQFNLDALPASLQLANMVYTHMPGLGGLRHTQADSLNGAWRNTSFRGYADYMQTPEFSENVEKVVQLALNERCVLMCAEAVPWRCHRSLIADALTVRGVRVEDIMNDKQPKVHALTPWAHVEGLTITYPPEVNP